MKPQCYLLLAVSCFNPVVHADTSNYRDEVGWEFSVGVGLEREPGYTGSDVYNNEADIELSAIYTTATGTEFIFGLGELEARGSLSDQWGYRAKLEYEEGRENASDPILTGFTEVEATVEGQFTLIRRLNDQWFAAAVFQPDLLDRGKGLVYFVALQNQLQILGNSRLTTTVDVSFADREHMNTEFGISEANAVASGLPVFTPDSGLKSVSAGFDLSYPLNNSFAIGAQLALEYYLSNASDSPLISDEGSDLNYEFGIGIEYEF